MIPSITSALRTLDRMPVHPGARVDQVELWLQDLPQAGPMDRRDHTAHLTASAIPVSPDGRLALLCLHPRWGRWGPLGGHVEPQDATIEDTVMRELREEAGDLPWRILGVASLSRHPVACRPHGGIAEHWDVLFAVTVERVEPPQLNAEITQASWFDVHDLPVPLSGASSPAIGATLRLLATAGVSGPMRGRR